MKSKSKFYVGSLTVALLLLATLTAVAVTVAPAWAGETGPAAPGITGAGDTDYFTYLPLVSKPCPALLSDDFSNPGSGWPINDNGNVRWEYLDGEYRMLLRNAGWWAGAFANYQTSDYVALVDVRNASGAFGSYGLLFGLSPADNIFYTFEVFPDGYYAVWRFSNGNWSDLAAAYSPHVNTGTAVNRLKAERTGSLIRVFANGQLLTSIHDWAYTGPSYSGLFVSSYDQPNVDARFDNFALYALSCAPVALAPVSPESPEMAAVQLAAPHAREK